jgi:DMSO/TMAO reductase YedYZ molybdopterin-dependent catalytic subunit
MSTGRGLRIPRHLPRRLRIPRLEDFSHRLRGPRLTSRIGLWLGISLTIAFLTGLWSHVQYTEDTPGWLTVPTDPYWLYRVTQGLHVVSGTAAVPLLLVKLWSVFPRLFVRPPWRPSRAAVLHALERLSILVLMAAVIFELATGLANAAQWYPWSFSFLTFHYAVGWVFIGALLVHVAVKLPVIRQALGEPLDADVPDSPDGPHRPEPARAGGLTRRGLLRTTWAAAGLAVLATAGAAVPWLRRISVFGVTAGDGPQGVPVNKTAEEARVGRVDPATWRLEVAYDGTTRQFSLDELRAMPQASHELPIACVEGWSDSGTWTGVPLADVVEAMGAPVRSRVFAVSIQQRGAWRTSELPEQFVEDRRTLLALDLNGEPLHPDHGFPCRIIAPNRPGVLQTKWVRRLEVYA